MFINLESIGPGGAPIVFQHAGAWTIEAFAKGSVHPRGAIAAQVGAKLYVQQHSLTGAALDSRRC